jgi:hypothetical protein
VADKDLVKGKDWDYTPTLRADATDDEDGEGEPKYAEGGFVSADDLGGSVVTPAVSVCPVCGLESCGHNLPKVEKS